MTDAEWRDDDDPRLRVLFKHSLRRHVAYQDGRYSEAPACVFADYDYEVGDGSCGLHEDGKRANEPAIVYVRADQLIDATDRIAELEAEIERLQAKLIEEREARLWDAYGAGTEREGEWEHSHMPNTVWLLWECGIDPGLRWHNAAMIREAIPEAAKRVLKEGKGDV